VNLDEAALTKKLTSVWCAVVQEHGGRHPLAEEHGWEPDGTPRGRDPHPAGARIKSWIQKNPTRTAADLDAVLTKLREHARAWATQQGVAA